MSKVGDAQERTGIDTRRARGLDQVGTTARLELNGSQFTRV